MTKRIKKYILTLFLSLPSLLFGQAWEKTYGGSDNDYGRSSKQTSDGGFIISGRTAPISNSNLSDILIIKTDNIGAESWSYTYGGPDFDEGRSIQETIDGNFVLTGSTGPFQESDVCLLKIDNQGNELWFKTFGGTEKDEGYSVRQTIDEGFLIAGSTNSFSLGNSNLYLIKTNK